MKDCGKLYVLLLDQNIKDLLLVHSALAISGIAGRTIAITNVNSALSFLESRHRPGLVIFGSETGFLKDEISPGSIMKFEHMKNVPAIELSECNNQDLLLSELILDRCRLSEQAGTDELLCEINFQAIKKSL